MTMSLVGFSDGELKAELERRAQRAKERDKPQQVENPNLTKLREVCQEYIDELADGNKHEAGDYREYIYEAALECIFGEGVFVWTNEKLR